jgi:hypothetical protein
MRDDPLAWNLVTNAKSSPQFYGKDQSIYRRLQTAPLGVDLQTATEVNGGVGVGMGVGDPGSRSVRGEIPGFWLQLLPRFAGSFRSVKGSIESRTVSRIRQRQSGLFRRV